MTSDTSQSDANPAEAGEVEAGQVEVDKKAAGQMESDKKKAGQVDFYLLKDASLSADHLACRLAMMAWERRQEVFVVVTSGEHLAKLNKLMWQYPPDRFLPHAQVADQNAKKAPVVMGLSAALDSDLKGASVVINLCPEAIPQATRFSRILEIVPFVQEQRDASRAKYKNYLQLGLKPQTHEIT